MIKPTKNFWFWVVAILIAGFFLFHARFEINLKKPADDFGLERARLTIIFDNGEERIFEGQVFDDTTLPVVLYAISRNGGPEIRYSIQNDGAVNVFSIGGYSSQNGGKTWRFLVNGGAVSYKEAGEMVIKNGDSIEVRYE